MFKKEIAAAKKRKGKAIPVNTTKKIIILVKFFLCFVNKYWLSRQVKGKPTWFPRQQTRTSFIKTYKKLSKKTCETI